jgi:hypothetical protein
MNRLRLWARSVVLRWLGYGFDPHHLKVGYRGSVGAVLGAAYFAVKEGAAVSIFVEGGVRRVPEVPPGTVRVVIEVCR